jgi:NAD(P)-dependent dehydrogenase (short-subunit alcohol dehydrogenase family)
MRDRPTNGELACATASDARGTPPKGNEKRKASADRHPLKRIGNASEVAQAAAFLLGSESGFMTGQVMKIDGGISTLKML